MKYWRTLHDVRRAFRTFWTPVFYQIILLYHASISSLLFTCPEFQILALLHRFITVYTNSLTSDGYIPVWKKMPDFVTCVQEEREGVEPFWLPPLYPFVVWGFWKSLFVKHNKYRLYLRFLIFRTSLHQSNHNRFPFSHTSSYCICEIFVVRDAMALLVSNWDISQYFR